MARHVRKGDTVVVTAGSDRGKVGEVLRVVEDGARVVVKGVNIRTRHVRPTQQQPKGAILREEMPIHASNVSPAVDGKPSRVRFTVKPDGAKVRVAVRGGKELGAVSPARTAPAAGTGAAKSPAKSPSKSPSKRKSAST